MWVLDKVVVLTNCTVGEVDKVVDLTNCTIGEEDVGVR